MLFCQRADACGLYIGEADCFFRLRGWRTRGLHGRPLVNHRRPRPFPPWESTLNVRTLMFLHRCSISSGPTADGTSSISPFARRINRASTMMSGTDNTVARSTPRRNVLCVRPFDSVEARSAMQIVRLVSSTCLLHLCGDKSDEKSSILGVERILCDLGYLTRNWPL